MFVARIPHLRGEMWGAPFCERLYIPPFANGAKDGAPERLVVGRGWAPGLEIEESLS
jgi:hypothetical protein